MGEILHGNDGIFDILDILLCIVMVLFVLDFRSSGVSVSAVTVGVVACMIFALICYLTYRNHSMENRSSILYYTENAPAGGHLILFVVLMVYLFVWLGVYGVKWTVNKVKHNFG